MNVGWLALEELVVWTGLTVSVLAGWLAGWLGSVARMAGVSALLGMLVDLAAGLPGWLAVLAPLFNPSLCFCVRERLAPSLC